jgi:hypothetical protein
MSATGTVSVQPTDGALSGGFVRGFACRPGTAPDTHGSMAPTPDDTAHEPPPEFRLTTVLPGVAVEIEVGAFTRE